MFLFSIYSYFERVGTWLLKSCFLNSTVPYAMQVFFLIKRRNLIWIPHSFWISTIRFKCFISFVQLMPDTSPSLRNISYALCGAVVMNIKYILFVNRTYFVPDEVPRRSIFCYESRSVYEARQMFKTNRVLFLQNIYRYSQTAKWGNPVFLLSITMAMF